MRDAVVGLGNVSMKTYCPKTVDINIPLTEMTASLKYVLSYRLRTGNTQGLLFSVRKTGNSSFNLLRNS